MTAWKMRTASGALALGCFGMACTSILGDVPTANVIDDDSGADASAADASGVDVSSPDTSGPDAGGPDTGSGDSGSDTGSSDTGSRDTGGGDALPPVDSSVDAGPTCGPGTALCGGASCVSLNTNTDCGGCGLACPTGCTSGQCIVTLASNIPKATGIAINGFKAYVTSYQANGNLYAMSLSGGGATNLTPNYPQPEPFGVAIDSSNVYWTNYNAGGTAGSVMKMPIGGQVAPTNIAPNQTAPSMIVVDAQDQNLYWTNFGTPGSVQRYALASGTLSTLIGGINDPAGIAVDSTYAYVALESDDYIIKVLLSSGAATQITAFQNNPYGLAIDSKNVYFTNQATSGDARQASQNGGSTQAGTVLGATALPQGIATDGTSVYWAGGNAIYKAAVGGAANSGKVFVPNQSGAAFVAVDSTSVYWTNSTAGTVMKVTPK